MTQRKRTIPRQPSASNGPPPQSGGSLFEQPEYDLPDLPVNLTDINDDTLMELFVQFTGWQNYAAVQLAEAEVEESKAIADVKFLEAQGMVRNFGARSTVTQVRAATATTTEMERARTDELNAYAKRKLTKVIYENCERSVFVISRELSRRIGQAGGERRIGRWMP
jgi:hypothetical protein